MKIAQQLVGVNIDGKVNFHKQIKMISGIKPREKIYWKKWHKEVKSEKRKINMNTSTTHNSETVL